MGRKPTPIFRERQNPVQRHTYIALIVPPCIMVGLVVWQVVLGHTWGKKPMTNGSLIGWTVFVWLIYLRLVTVRMTTEVRAGKIVVAMRGLWPARTIPLAGVKAAQQVVYDPVADYGGYGIRSNRSGKAYIARGTEGVKVELTTGGSVLLGSQRSRELVAAIRSGKSLPPAS